MLFLFMHASIGSLLLFRSSFSSILFVLAIPHPSYFFTPLLQPSPWPQGGHILATLLMPEAGSSPPLQMNIFTSSPRWYEISFGAIDKCNNNKQWSWFAKRRGLYFCFSIVSQNILKKCLKASQTCSHWQILIHKFYLLIDSLFE